MGIGVVSTVEQRQQRVTHAVRIDRPAIALYRAWHDLSRRQADQIEVRRAGALGIRSSAIIKAPCVGEMSSAVLVDHIPGLFLSWQSLPHTAVQQMGEVWFYQTSVEQATEVRIILSWEHTSTSAIASEPEFDRARAQIEQDLARFKQLMEQR